MTFPIDSYVRRLREVLAALLTRGSVVARLFWRTLWRTTAAIALLLLTIIVLRNFPNNLPPPAELPLATVVAVGYCTYVAFWIGLTAAVLAVGWHLWGVLIVPPLLGGLGGAVAAAALTLYALEARIPKGAGGLHGGGHVLALLVLALLGAVAIAGAGLGGLVGTAVSLVWSQFRHHDRIPPADHLS